jgi:hypothetical protein
LWRHGPGVVANAHRQILQHVVHPIGGMLPLALGGALTRRIDRARTVRFCRLHARQPLEDRTRTLVVIEQISVDPLFAGVILDHLPKPLMQCHSFAHGCVARSVPKIGIYALDGPRSGSVHLKSILDSQKGQTRGPNQTGAGLNRGRVNELSFGNHGKGLVNGGSILTQTRPILVEFNQ